VSSGAQVAVLGPHRIEPPAARPLRVDRRPLVTLAAFGLLGSYGVLRWGTMLSPEPGWRLLGLVALALVIVALGPAAHAERSDVRAGAVAGMVVASIAIIPMSGFPLRWLLHLRIAVAWRGIGNGLSALPTVVVPYGGPQRFTTAVIVVGAGLLLLVAALTLATARRPFGEVRLGAAAVPLIVLAIVPSALARPQVAYVHGVILFVLLAGLIFSERVSPRRMYVAGGLVASAAVGALLLAPVIDQRSPWVSFETIAGTLGPARGETFDWRQTYGPLNWPQTGKLMLEVAARNPSYWKSEDFDEFNGVGWVSAYGGQGSTLGYVDPANLRQWAQTLTVTIRGLSTTQVIAAGTADPPTGLPGAVQPGATPGTWVDSTPLVPPQSYSVTVYTPEPSPLQLETAGVGYPLQVLAPDLEMTLPPIGQPHQFPSQLPAQNIQFAPYGSTPRLVGFAGLTNSEAASALRASPYGGVYALARRLLRGTATPYEYLQAVLGYLAHGFTYNQSPTLTQYPIVTFLMRTKLGYCQQFAGALALLLRMGGVPARVATGFATGTFNPNTQTYDVTDLEAHAWVEVWFPQYGWVKFDPTPPSAPARTGKIPISADNPAPSKSSPNTASSSHGLEGAKGVGQRQRSGSGGSSGIVLAVVLALVLLVAASIGIWLLRLRRRHPTGEALLAELERAFTRCGRPLPSGTTLAELEDRLGSSGEGAEYIRAIRLGRYAPAAPVPTAAQRRALRRQLALGMGWFARSRAFLALPPRGLH
jgi:transglutaminase-like putative cysteine protease